VPAGGLEDSVIAALVMNMGDPVAGAAADGDASVVGVALMESVAVAAEAA
jgi:hypothetical protein